MKRFKLFLAVAAIISGMASCSSDDMPEPAQNYPDSFFDITVEDVASAAGSLSGHSMDAIDIVPIISEGTVLIYQTSDGRYGKMQITNYDFDDNHKMSFKFVTYTLDNSGHIDSGSDVAEVKGTFTFNLDANQIEIIPMPDFWWERVTADYTRFTPKNGATFAKFNFNN